MAFSVHQVPGVGGSGDLEDLNRFLRTHRVLSTERRLVETSQGAYWTFCVVAPQQPRVPRRPSSDRGCPPQGTEPVVIQSGAGEPGPGECKPGAPGGGSGIEGDARSLPAGHSISQGAMP